MPAVGDDRSSSRFAGLVLLLVLPAFVLLLVLVEVRWRPLLAVDGQTRDRLYRVAVEHDALVRLLRAASVLGTSGAYLVGALVLGAWLLRAGRPRAALLGVLAVTGSALLNAAVKALVDRPRPVLPEPVAYAGSSSFPSGHAQGAVVAAGVLVAVLAPGLPRRPRTVLLLGLAAWVLLTGIARLVLGVHYASDVVAGFLLGAAWLAVVLTVLPPEPARPARDRRRDLAAQEA